MDEKENKSSSDLNSTPQENEDTEEKGAGERSQNDSPENQEGEFQENEDTEEEEEATQVMLSPDEFKDLQSRAEERDDYLDRLRRAVADNMNLQQRLEKIRQNARFEALREVARKVLPLAEGLARARENAEQTEGADNICEGLKLTEKEFYDMLHEMGVEPIDSLGEPFDPDYHEALSQKPTSQAEPNTVVEELKKGFLLNGKLLRPAQVIVAARPKNEEPKNQQEEVKEEKGESYDRKE